MKGVEGTVLLVLFGGCGSGRRGAVGWVGRKRIALADIIGIIGVVDIVAAVVVIVINAGCAINAKESDPIHHGQFSEHENAPNQTVDCRCHEFEIVHQTGRVAQDSRDNPQGATNVQIGRFARGLQLFPNRHTV